MSFRPGGSTANYIRLTFITYRQNNFVLFTSNLRVFRAYLSTTIMDTPESEPEPPQTPTRSYACCTTRTDRIRIRIPLDWVIPRTIRWKYGYTLRQIRTAKESPLTPQKKGKCGAKTSIKTPKRRELVNWLLRSPSHRHMSFGHIANFVPELGLEGYGIEAIRAAFKTEGYRRRIAKRKGFSDNPVVMDYRVRFA